MDKFALALHVTGMEMTSEGYSSIELKTGVQCSKNSVHNLASVKYSSKINHGHAQ
jgi:hypothetical protein